MEWRSTSHSKEIAGHQLQCLIHVFGLFQTHWEWLQRTISFVVTANCVTQESLLHGENIAFPIPPSFRYMDFWYTHVFWYETIDFHLRCKIIQRILLVRTQADCINSASFPPLDSFRSVHQWPIPPTQSHHLSKPFADCSGRHNNSCAEMRLIISGGAENSMATAPYQHCVYWKSMSLIINKKRYQDPRCVVCRVKPTNWPWVKHMSTSLKYLNRSNLS